MNGYLQDCNSGNPARLAAHNAPNVACKNYDHRQTGFDGDRIALEADMPVIALADLPIRASRTFGFYTTDGPLIRHVGLAESARAKLRA